MKEDISTLWEERSRFYKERMNGVLPKSFPSPVNNYLHSWMFEQIKKVIPAGKTVKVLDLGCGYGRLSKEVLKKFPKSLTFGIDISETYVNLYNQNLSPRGKATSGDVRKLPFKNSSFDVIFVVTTLMYITKKSDQEKVMTEIFRVLKAKGKYVIIERNPSGYGLVTLGGFVSKIRGRKFREIPAVSFDVSSMKLLIKRCGGEVIDLHGIPFLTMSLPLLFLLSIINRNIAERILKGVSFFDRVFSWLLTPSLYISYIGEKKL